MEFRPKSYNDDLKDFNILLIIKYLASFLLLHQKKHIHYDEIETSEK